MIEKIEQLTPALHGMKENLTIEAIVKQWNTCIQPVLNDEIKEIYRVACIIIPSAKGIHTPRENSYDAFEAFLSNWKRRYLPEDSSSERSIFNSKKRCLRGVFDQYWDIYDRFHYNGSISFEELQSYWFQNYKDTIQKSWEDLLFWHGKM